MHTATLINDYLPSKRMPRAHARIVWQALVMLIIGLWLDAFVDLAACEYDACRYVKLTYLEYISIFDADLFSSTTLMHFIYGDLVAGGMPFLKVAIFHAIALWLVVLLFQVTNPILKSPLFVALLAIPGKEFYLLVSILLIFPGDGSREQGRPWLVRLLLVFVLLFLSRLTYLPLFLLAYVLAYCYRRSGVSRFLQFSLASIFFLSALMAFVGFKEGVRDIADQEATVQGVNFLRDYTFGFSPIANVLRFFAYVGYLIMLPAAEAMRAFGEVSSGNFYPAQPFLWAAVLEWFAYLFLRSRQLVFVVILVASMLVAIVFPFIHTRYLLPLVLFIQAYAYGCASAQPFVFWRSK